jgi:hypothetical protein
LSAREAQVERYRMQIVMANICAGGDLARWLEMADNLSPEEVGMIADAALDKQLMQFLRNLNGSDFATSE